MTLEEIRAKIDAADDELARLMAARLELSAQEAVIRQENGLPPADPQRDRDILYRVTGINGEALETPTRIFFDTLLALSRGSGKGSPIQDSAVCREIVEAIERTPQLFPQRALVACQGVEGAYSQQAACKLFSLPSITYFRRFEGVFQAVEGGQCRYGVLPIENSSAGSVTEVYDLIERYNCRIVHSLKLQVSHCLLAKPGTKIEDIKEIISHEQALNQCNMFLTAHPGIKVTPFANTAAAAKFVAETDRTDIAAIGSSGCAALYGLEILTDRIMNSDHNYTRFICISKDMEIYPDAGKLTVMTVLPHAPGSLSALIARFAAQGLNLCKIESRPILGKNFEFRFYLDVEADVHRSSVQEILARLEKETKLSFLGAYAETL